jgi:large subunit ribosomal protein L7A
LPEIHLTLGRVYAIILNCVGLEPANFAMQGDISTRRLSMLEELSCENRVVGLKQTRRLLAAGHAGRVFLAKDADPALVEPLLAACRAVGVPAVTEFTMSQLGRAAGIAVGTAAAAVPSR